MLVNVRELLPVPVAVKEGVPLPLPVRVPLDETEAVPVEVLDAVTLGV